MTEIKVLLFGQIAEIIGKNHITVSGIENTDGLRKYLFNEYPELNSVQFSLAVDKTLVDDDTPLENQSEIALLPPFSGG